MKSFSRIRFNAPVMILTAAIISSSCGMLGALGGGLAGGCTSLTDDSGLGLAGTSTGTTLGYEVSTSGRNDQQADAGYLYGIWKPQ